MGWHGSWELGVIFASSALCKKTEANGRKEEIKK
jgi:hypothetical protein